MNRLQEGVLIAAKKLDDPNRAAEVQKELRDLIKPIEATPFVIVLLPVWVLPIAVVGTWIVTKVTFWESVIVSSGLLGAMFVLFLILWLVTKAEARRSRYKYKELVK